MRMKDETTRATYHARLRRDEDPRTQLPQPLLKLPREDVRPTELAKVVGERKVSGSGEAARLADASAEELAEMLGCCGRKVGK